MRTPLTERLQRSRSVAATLGLLPLTAASFGLLLVAWLGGLADERRERERGDVPGWVLITLMTAGLVTTIWALAGEQLGALFTQAISSVTGPGKK